MTATYSTFGFSGAVVKHHCSVKDFHSESKINNNTFHVLPSWPILFICIHSCTDPWADVLHLRIRWSDGGYSTSRPCSKKWCQYTSKMKVSIDWTVDGNQKSQTTTWDGAKARVNKGISTTNLNWWVDPGFLVAINSRDSFGASNALRPHRMGSQSFKFVGLNHGEPVETKKTLPWFTMSMPCMPTFSTGFKDGMQKSQKQNTRISS